MTTKIEKALDVWLKFDAENSGEGYPADEEASHEANTFKRGGKFVVEWYHTAVGQISRKEFDSHAEAQAWLTAEGFQDFTS